MADLLVAVRLIEVDRHHHRHKDRFQFRSHAAKAALRCTALSTRLPVLMLMLSSLDWPRQCLTSPTLCLQRIPAAVVATSRFKM
uniref:Uncharacterized protein n=1 Tax=Oryza glumipatula TaxID=40148 RepID=A0A0E0A7X3_9ORYZ